MNLVKTEFCTCDCVNWFFISEHNCKARTHTCTGMRLMQCMWLIQYFFAWTDTDTHTFWTGNSFADGVALLHTHLTMHFRNTKSVMLVGLNALTAWFPGSIHSDFDGAVVGGYLWWSGEHGDGQSEALSCSTETSSWYYNRLHLSACEWPFLIVAKTIFSQFLIYISLYI